VGGHRPEKKGAEKPEKGILQHHDLILKPLEQGSRAKNELTFYQSLFKLKDHVLLPLEQEKTKNDAFFDSIFESLDEKLKELQNLVPRFHGTIKFHREGTLTSYLKLENLCYPFKNPSVVDLKMGTQSYDENASAEKIASEKKKYPHQEVLGFRFTGMKVYQLKGSYKDYDRFYGRHLTPENITDGFYGFLDNGSSSPRFDIVPLVIEKLEKILDWFKTQQFFRFYSSSLLIVYEGNPASFESTSYSGPILDVRLIDFAHSTPILDGKEDQGYIKGLHNVLQILSNINQIRTV